METSNIHGQRKKQLLIKTSLEQRFPLGKLQEWKSRTERTFRPWRFLLEKRVSLSPVGTGDYLGTLAPCEDDDSMRPRSQSREHWAHRRA